MASIYSPTQLIQRISIAFALLFCSIGFLKAQLPTITCTFDATLPLVPCVSNFSATINYNFLPLNTQVALVFPNSVSFDNVDAQISPAGQDGQFYNGSFSLSGSGQILIPLSFSTCNVNGNESIYSLGSLQFGCFASLPNGANINVSLVAPQGGGSSFVPDDGGALALSVNTNPISLTATPVSEQYNTIPSSGSRTFTISINNAPELQSFIWNYSVESDIVSSINTPINNGANQVSILPFNNNQLTIPEDYILSSCIPGVGQANVTIDCPAECPDIVRSLNVNAFLQDEPPTFSISEFNIETPQGLPNGCDQEYVFNYHFEIEPAQPITLENLDIPINLSIYPVTDILINGSSVGTSMSNPIVLNSDNGFEVEIRTGFTCDYFQSCAQTSNLLYNVFQNIELEYSRECDEEITSVEINLSNSGGGQEFLGTFIGGPQTIDFSAEEPTIPAMYEFMTSTGFTFGLSQENDCDVQYRLVLSAEDGFGLPVGIASDASSFSEVLEINFDYPTLEQYLQIPLNITFQDCPYVLSDGPEFPASGPVTIHAEIQAYCSECPSCYRTLRCSEQIITAHCNGDCTSDIGTNFEPAKPSIIRITFGWENESNYKNAQPSLSNLPTLDPIVLTQQLTTFYPYDIFELVAFGHSENINQQIGFEIAYPAIAGVSFQFIEGKITSNNDNSTSMDGLNCFTTETLTGDVFGYDNVEKFRIWYNPSCPGNIDEFKIIARVRVLNSREVGFVEEDFRLQFIANNNGPEVLQSCDSYGYRLTFLAPGYDYERYQMPITQPSIPVNPPDDLDPLNPLNQLIVENNPLKFANEIVINQNVDLCRTTAGILVSGYGAKGGNAPDFPFEYRPMVDWPASASFSRLVFAESYINSNNIYEPLESIQDPNPTPVRFLPPIDASNQLDNIDGVYLEFSGDCASSDEVQVISDDFKIFHHAYVNDPSFMLDPTIDLVNVPPMFPDNSVFYEKPFSSEVNFLASLNFDFSSILSTPTYSLNGNNYNIPITLSQPQVPAGDVILENLLVYYYLTNSDGSSIDPTLDNSNVQPIGAYASEIANSYSVQNGFAYYFNNAIEGDISGLIPVSSDCIEDNYRLVIEMLHFCDENGFNEFVATGEEPCDKIIRVINLNPQNPNAISHQSNISLHQGEDPDDCYVEWNITYTNSLGRPEIINPEFIFNAPNGLILVDQILSYSGPSGSNSVNLNEPVFGLEPMAPPFQNNLLATFSLSPIQPNFIFEAGGTLVYTIRFQYSSNLCESGTAGFNLLGRLLGEGACSAENEIFNLNNFSQLLPSSNPDPASTCCVQPPIEVLVINACPSNDGQIVLNALNGNTLDATIIEVYGVDGELTNINLIGTSTSIALPIGFYGVLVTLGNGNQMAFTANIQNGAITIQPNIAANTVCQNTLFTGSVTDINPLNSAPYTYAWVGPNPQTDVVSAANTYSTYNPIQGEYTVSVTNDLTGCTASYTFDIFVDSPPSEADAGEAQEVCIGSAQLNATIPNVGAGLWTGPGVTFLDATSPSTTVSGLSVGPNILTWTTSNGVCDNSTSEVIVEVLVNPTIDAGADQTICGTTANLDAISPQTGYWSVVSGSGVFTDENSPTTEVTGLSFGENVFSWNFDNSVCDPVSNQVTITAVENPSTAFAGLNQTICLSVGQIQLNATPPAVGSGSWSGPANAVFDSNSSPNAIVTGLGFGTYTFNWTVSNQSCISGPDPMLVTIQAPPLINAGVDISVCTNQAQLNADPIADGVWSVVSGNSTFTNANNNISGVSNLDMGANTFQWSVNHPTCGVISDEMIVTQYAPPTVEITLPNEMCTEQSFELEVSPLGGTLTLDGVLYSDSVQGPINVEGYNFSIGTINVIYSIISQSGCEFTQTGSFEVIQECLCLCPNPLVTRYEVPSSVTTSNQLMIELGSTNTITNRCLKFNSSLTILGNTGAVTFDNCDLSFAPGTELIVTQGSGFSIFDSKLHGCEAMWAGIKNNGRTLIKSSLIRDARIGFEMVRIQNGLPSTLLIGVTFSNNFIGLSNSWQTGNHMFKGPIDCLFTGGPLLPAYTNQIPAPNPLGGYTGIRVANKFTIIIDETNTFKNLYNGIIIFNSRAKIEKAIFSNIQYDPSNLLYPNNSYSSVQSIMNFGNHPNFPSAAVNVAARSNVLITGLGTDENEPNVMFYGCRNSITNHQSTLMVNDVRINGEDDMPSEIGVFILNNINAYSFDVSNNRIKTTNAGIIIVESGNFIAGSGGSINNNNITILDHFDLSEPDIIDLSTVKFGIAKSSQLNSSAIRLTNNTVNLQTWVPSIGIFMNQSNGVQLNSNLLRRHTTSIGQGIRVESNNGANVSCNHSIGMSNEVMNERNEAYTIASSSLTLADNYSDHTQTGISINEPCPGIAIKNNEMANHTYNPNTTVPSGAIYLGQNADIGFQTDMYNRFTTPNSWAVKHIDNSHNNFFFIDPFYQSPEFYPQHDPANLSDCSSDPFFVCLQNPILPPLPTDPCGSSIIGSTILGMAIANPDGTIGMVEAAAKREISYPVFNEESRFSLEKTLELGLKEGSLNLPDTGVFISWKDSLYASNASKLNDYGRTIHAENVDSAHIQLAIQWKSAAQLAFDSSMTWLSEINEVEDFETEIWLQRQIQLIILQSDADSLQEELKIADENRILSIVDSAEAKNQQVSLEREYETMERTINEIYLQTLARGIFDYTAEQWSSISYIAWQCPLKSASAVYKARGMYGIVEPFTRFDNYSICASQDMQYRLAQEKPTEKNIEREKFMVYPNPNAGLLQIEMNEKEGIAQFEIVNTLGQTILKWQHSDAKQILDLSKFQISSGMYYIRVKQVDGTSMQQKFIYQKQ